MTFNRKWIKPPTNDSITSNVANKILENKFVPPNFTVPLKIVEGLKRVI